MAEYALRDGRMLTIRPAVPADAAALVDYMNRVGGESDNLGFGAGECRYTPETEAEYLAAALKNPTSIALIALVAGEIVASMNVGGMPRAREAHVAGLGISVRADHWRLGIGERLMREGIAFARGTGILRVMHLDVRADNAGAIALYERFGFAHVGIHKEAMCIGGQYHDLVLMELHL